MARAIFDFGAREPDSKAAPAERAPCPLCGEPRQMEHAYCARCGFRLPWAAQIEGLPETEPRRNRLDHAVERAISSSADARCRFCAAPIGAYDRRCQSCGRWLSSNWNRAALDAWQPDFDAWNFSQVRGFGAGCLSPIALAVAVILWRVLA
jgi:predicted amidophosphoribosyltransferase